MITVKLLHIKCCFFQFFNSPVALKKKKNLAPQEKVEMTPLSTSLEKIDVSGRDCLFLLPCEACHQIISMITMIIMNTYF